VFYGLTSGDVRVPDEYPENTYVTARPSGAKVFVRPNEYEPGRANIVVYNWDHDDEVAVDLSQAGIASGAPFEVRDAQNFFGAPVFAGTFNQSTIKLPMTGLTTVRPVGVDARQPPHTGPEFAVFVVVPAARAESWWTRWRERLTGAL
jgi:hypothetical protein